MKAIFLSALLLVGANNFAQKLTADEQRIKKVFFDFLLFYKKNEKKFNSFKLYSGSGKENNPPYRINWDTGVQQYFNYLRKYVPFVGEAYIKAETGHFKNAEQNFKEYPDEEIAMGFDYDRWAGGQENIDYTYKWYTSPENTYHVIISGNKAKLRIGSPKEKEGDTQFWSFVPFVKERGKWKMADNIYPEDE
ncbi:MAG TPA: hypothetical protein PK504_04650 [Ferruginibacter sp.]|nr:hypothetical protein [Ferruginibacter sp.]HRE63565.1 hypothetical protein [Ferruginibacter sp.]